MKAELLAPAGDFDCVKAAVQAGADAVYIGARRFSARQNAANFDDDELDKTVSYCHLRGVKVYLAINTLILDKELPEALKTAKSAYESGVDAYIVQDLGLIKLLSESFDIPVHASTQMTVFDEDGLMYLKRRGIKRAVLARECRDSEIEKMAKQSGMELEVFCHGAICMCYSGQCLMSSMLGGRSANRGSCAQPCRLPYNIDKKEGFYLSPKDMCLIDEIPAMMKMGVSSLKIEGRMKGPSYVAAATAAFRKCIDSGKYDELDIERLLKAFARGGAFTKGCYAAAAGSEMMNVGISNDNVLRSADKDFVKSLENFWREGTEIKKLPISMELSVESEKTILKITDNDGNLAISEMKTNTEERGKPLDAEFAKLQLEKLGGTQYLVERFDCKIGLPAYFSAAELNKMRREAVGALNIERNKKRTYTKNIVLPEYKGIKPKSFYIAVQVKNIGQYRALKKAGARRIYGDYALDKEVTLSAAVIPAVYKELPSDLNCGAVIAGSIGAYNYATDRNKKIIADYTMNVFNSVSAAEFYAVTLSAELSLKQCAHISHTAPCEAVAYGYLPLMVSRNCVIRGAGKCKGENCEACSREITLTDRKGVDFRDFANGGFNTVYNSVPLFMADRLDELKAAGLCGIRLYFTNETPEECVKIYKMYIGEAKIELPISYTRGHFYRGY